MGKFYIILLISMNTFPILRNASTVAWIFQASITDMKYTHFYQHRCLHKIQVNGMGSKTEDAKKQKLNGLSLMSIEKGERRKRQIEESAYLRANQIFTKLDNTVAGMITTVAIYELNDMNVYIATKLNCLKYVAETIQMINKQIDNGSIIWIFMLIIYWMLIPVFIWVAIILFMWKNLRLHWRKIIVPMATAKHCEVSGNLLNARNEIMTMPAWDGVLEARFEQTTQSEHDEIEWSDENPTEMQDQKEESANQ